MTPDMLNLQWNAVALYPAGYFARQIMIEASVRLPEGWQFATALETAASNGGVTTFKPYRFDTLVDSPIFAGRYFKRLDLDPGGPAPVHLDIVADRADLLEVKPEQLRSAPRPGAAGLQTLRLASLRSLRFSARPHRPNGRHRPGASPVERERHGPHLLHRMGQERRRPRSAAARIHALLERQVPASGGPVDAELQRAHARQPAVGLRRPNPVLGFRSRGACGTSDQAANPRCHGSHCGTLRSPRRPRMARASGHHQ